MHNKLVLLLLALGLATVTAKQKNWVLIVAGAKDYENYFSQSTACHSYHTVRKLGVPESNIIQMSYDDVANNKQNPYPGNLVVLPNSTVNMYEGCKIDYSGHEVTPQAFLKVLQGDKAGLKQLLGRDGPVIESGPDDHVFVTMVDHGGPGVFYFPGFVALHATQLNKALKNMHSANKYKKMVLYVESCESGSMFYKQLPDNINIYGSTCANPNESGYMCCYDDKRGVYVGTYYANGWEYDSDKSDPKARTIAQQYTVMVDSCKNKSHPQQYGDLSINKEVLGEYQGNLTSATLRFHSMMDSWAPHQKVQGRLEFAGIDLNQPPIDQVHIATLARRLMTSDDVTPAQTNELKRKLYQALNVKNTAERFVRDIAVLVVGESNVDHVVAAKESVANGVCYEEALNALNNNCPGLHFGKFPFIRRNLHTIINLCNMKPFKEVVEGIVLASTHQPMCRSE